MAKSSIPCKTQEAQTTALLLLLLGTQSHTHILEKYWTNELWSPRTRRQPSASTCQPGRTLSYNTEGILAFVQYLVRDQQCVLKGNMLTEVWMDMSKEAEG